MIQRNEWYIIPVGVTSQLHSHADQRHDQKRSFSSSRYWHDDSHFIGLIGEWLVSRLTDRPYDVSLRITGDQGFDFPNTDVKTSTFLADPHLKHPVNAKSWTGNYVLCVFDAWNMKARVAGWATSQMLRNAPTRDYGYGSNFYLPESDLHPGLPSETFVL